MPDILWAFCPVIPMFVCLIIYYRELVRVREEGRGREREKGGEGLYWMFFILGYEQAGFTRGI